MGHTLVLLLTTRDSFLRPNVLPTLRVSALYRALYGRRFAILLGVCRPLAAHVSTTTTRFYGWQLSEGYTMAGDDDDDAHRDQPAAQCVL